MCFVLTGLLAFWVEGMLRTSCLYIQHHGIGSFRHHMFNLTVSQLLHRAEAGTFSQACPCSEEVGGIMSVFRQLCQAASCTGRPVLALTYWEYGCKACTMQEPTLTCSSCHQDYKSSRKSTLGDYGVHSRACSPLSSEAHSNAAQNV